jgi:isopenicillin N synthase-like dioxygenase
MTPIFSAYQFLIRDSDLLSFWTGGLLKSTVHRVVFPPPAKEGEKQADRYSIAYFCHPLDDAEIESVPSERVKHYIRDHETKNVEGKEGKALTAKQHLLARLHATYGGST